MRLKLEELVVEMRLMIQLNQLLTYEMCFYITTIIMLLIIGYVMWPPVICPNKNKGIAGAIIYLPILVILLPINLIVDSIRKKNTEEKNE